MDEQVAGLGDGGPDFGREGVDVQPSEPSCVGADGYGLSECQQKAAADLWAWQRESMRAEVVLGGPLAE